MPKKKNTEEADLIIPGKRTRKALSSAHLKASVEGAELSSDSNTEALKMTKKAKKETKATKGTKRSLKERLRRVVMRRLRLLKTGQRLLSEYYILTS